MARRTPHVANGMLHAQESPGAPEVAVDSPAWSAWLEDRATRSFSFEGQSGTFTARRERRSGGDEAYWSAYRKQDGKLRKAYLGKADKLTLARLEDAAARLAGHGEKATARPSSDALASDGEPSGRADAAATDAPTTANDQMRRAGARGDPLLLTKLSIPSARPSLVARPR